MNVDIFNYWNPCQFRFTGVKMQSASDQGSECFAAFLLNGQAYRVTVPHGVMPGSSFIVNANGQQFTITCPMNGGPGAIIEIHVPIRR